MILKIDSAAPQSLLDQLKSRPNIVRVASVSLPKRNV
jgi:hypothetical protein